MANTYNQGELFVYTNGDRWELGMVKRPGSGDGYFCWYSRGDTAAFTPTSCMHKLSNAGFTHIEQMLDDAMAGRSCASCPEMDNPDSYIVHLHRALEVANEDAGTCKLVIEKRPHHGPWIYHFECGYDFWQPTDCPMPILKHCPNCGGRIIKEEE